MEKGRQLLAVDHKIEKAITEVDHFWINDDSGDEDEEIKNGDQVKITSGVRSTVNMNMAFHSTTKCFYWLKDGKGYMHPRTKTNIEKVI